MKVTINRSIVEVPEAASLGEILVREQLAGPGIAVAVYNKVVPRAKWNEFLLSDGMKITLIQAVCGG